MSIFTVLDEGVFIFFLTISTQKDGGYIMLRILEHTEIWSFNKIKREYPYCRILVKISSLDDCEGQPVAVSDSVESDDDLCEKLHELLDRDILCVIVGSYMQGGSENVIYSIR